MAEVRFAVQEALIAGTVLFAGPLTSGDSTSEITFNEGHADVAVHVYGTPGGSTVTVLGSLMDNQFGLVDDAYGSPMSYTSFPSGVVKPIGPALQAMKVSVTGGSGVSVNVVVYIVKRLRG